MYGKDFGYAATRLQGTIVRLTKSGEPVYLSRVDGIGKCIIAPVHKLEDQSVIDLDDLNFKPIRLGYVNTGGQATYLMRIPMRRDWKQGLRRENCASSGRSIFNFPMQAFRDAVMGKYPKFDKAINDVVKDDNGLKTKVIAFNIHWAVDTNNRLYYKNHLIVGKIKGGKPQLDEKYKYLQECLEEAL